MHPGAEAFARQPASQKAAMHGDYNGELVEAVPQTKTIPCITTDPIVRGRSTNTVCHHGAIRDTSR